MKGFFVYHDDQPSIRTQDGTQPLPRDPELPEHTPIKYDEETDTIQQTGTTPQRPIPDFNDANAKTKDEHRYAYLRTQKQRRIFTAQDRIVEAAHDHYDDAEHLFTPCILGTASESGSDVFPVYYHGDHAYLRQDPQLHRQLCIIGGATKLYEIGPAWRAEQSHTSKHLSEHRVIAAEYGHIDDMHDVIDDAVKLLQTITKQLHDDNLIEKQKIPDSPPTYTFEEAKAVCKERGESVEDDLTSKAERILYEETRDESDVVIVTRFPDHTKPFYVMRDGEATESFDIIYKGTEISSGGQREHRHDQLIQTINEEGMDEDSVEWFTKAFTYGSPRHGGFAIGIERLTALLTDTNTVKDTTYFPRDPKKLVP
jgi:aspartyl-tRNA synthetase